MKRIVSVFLAALLLTVPAFAQETPSAEAFANDGEPSSPPDCLPAGTPEPAPTQTPYENWDATPMPLTGYEMYATPTPPAENFHTRYVAGTYDQNGRPDFLSLYRKPTCEADELLFQYWMGTKVEVLDYVDAHVAHVMIAGLEGYIHADSPLTGQDILSLGFARPKTALAYCPKQGLSGVTLYAEPSQMSREVAGLNDGETVWVLGIGEEWLHLYMPRYQETGFAKVQGIVENDVTVKVKNSTYLYQYPSARNEYITSTVGEGVPVYLLVDVPRYGWQKIRILTVGSELIAYIRTDDLDFTGTELLVLPNQP